MSGLIDLAGFFAKIGSVIIAILTMFLWIEAINDYSYAVEQ